MVWIIIAAVIAVLVVVIVAVIMMMQNEKSDMRSAERPGYQDVIVKDAVDVRTSLYVSGEGDYFPDDDIKHMTVPLIEGVQRWQIVFTDKNTGRRQRVSFDKSMLIGRTPVKGSKEPQLLTGQDKMVSRVHCRISNSGNGPEIEDLNSHNGTFLDGRKVTGRMPIRSGSELRVGDTVYHIQIFRG